MTTRTSEQTKTQDIKPFFLDLTEGEREDIARVFRNILTSGQLILGAYTKEFEAEFARYIGKRHGVALNTGTSALEILLMANGAAGKKVAVQSNTNFASLVTIIRAGATPVYMDMTAEYFAPNLEILKSTVERYDVHGVMWVHIGGVVAPDFPEVVEYCRKKKLFLVEDAAHAHGSEMSGIKAGAFADAGAFSFFPTKVMTTMEGGMIVTDSAEHAALARSLRNQGKRDGDYGGLHYDFGSSWRISEIAAYIGLVQLAKLDTMIGVRTRAARAMAKVLDRMRVSYCDTRHMTKASNYKFIVKLPSGKKMDTVKHALAREGVICGGGVYEVPCHLHPVFKDVPYKKEELRVTETWCPRHICPPITSGLDDAQIDRMGAALSRVLA